MCLRDSINLSTVNNLLQPAIFFFVSSFPSCLKKRAETSRLCTDSRNLHPFVSASLPAMGKSLLLLIEWRKNGFPRRHK